MRAAKWEPWNGTPGNRHLGTDGTFPSLHASPELTLQVMGIAASVHPSHSQVTEVLCGPPLIQI